MFDINYVSMEKLGSTCKELTSNLSVLIANCKIAAAQTGEIPLQQSVLGVIFYIERIEESEQSKGREGKGGEEKGKVRRRGDATR